MLTFIGMGLNGKGISVRGLERAREADEVYAELYTSLIPELDLEEIERRIDNRIETMSREDVEQNPEDMLRAAEEKKVAFLVPGDPMIATTHVDLRLRAENSGVETEIVHGASIQTAAAGLAGLQSYKFGRSATLPLSEKPSETPYNVLERNIDRGLHTLLLLDIKAKEERYLEADRAIEILLDLEEELGRGVLDENTLCIVVARAGTSDPVVRAGRAKKLIKENFGQPPHVLIVPGDLHFLEAEALRKIAGAPEEVVKNAEGRS